MTLEELHRQLALGEDSTRQFKSDIRNAESVAAEMAAFANSNGGAIYIGVDDVGTPIGLDGSDVSRINQIISNAASQLVRSPLIVHTVNVATASGRVVIVLTIPKGIDKPYFDRNGVIWLKAGSDKRRIHSKEELRRLFQFSEQFHADQLPTKATIARLDRIRLRDFLLNVHGIEYPEEVGARVQLLQNMGLATQEGALNLACVLLFVQKPEFIAPQFVIRAIRYPGNEIHTSKYLDAEEIGGTLDHQFERAKGFILRNLHKIQAGRGVNSPGLSEIPETTIEELLVNALIHRDYMVSAPIRLFLYDNRLEIISPGHLPNNLTVEKIRNGISNIRNPILASFAAKGLLPYHGLGSGIKRVLMNWPAVEFRDDQEGCLFHVTIHRKQPQETISAPLGAVLPDPGFTREPRHTSAERSSLHENGSPISSPMADTASPDHLSLQRGMVAPNPYGPIPPTASRPQTQTTILDLMVAHPSITTEHIASILGITKRAVLKHIRRLKDEGRLARVGSNRSGFWRVWG